LICFIFIKLFLKSFTYRNRATSFQEERSRSRTPYHRQELFSQNDTSLRSSEIQALNPCRQDTSYYTSLRRSKALNRNRSLSPYSLQEDSLSNRNRSRSPFSHHEDSLSNIRKNERRERNIVEESYRRNHERYESRETDREGKKKILI
jgi:hypothetical protein